VKGIALSFIGLLLQLWVAIDVPLHSIILNYFGKKSST
jgi:hypothetical protein